MAPVPVCGISANSSFPKLSVLLTSLGSSGEDDLNCSKDNRWFVSLVAIDFRVSDAEHVDCWGSGVTLETSNWGREIGAAAGVGRGGNGGGRGDVGGDRGTEPGLEGTLSSTAGISGLSTMVVSA